jgi:hypothetical protein
MSLHLVSDNDLDTEAVGREMLSDHLRNSPFDVLERCKGFRESRAGELQRLAGAGRDDHGYAGGEDVCGPLG